MKECHLPCSASADKSSVVKSVVKSVLFDGRTTLLGWSAADKFFLEIVLYKFSLML